MFLFYLKMEMWFINFNMTNLLILIPVTGFMVDIEIVHTVGVNIKFLYRLKNPVVLWRTNVFKTVTIYRFYGVYTLTIFTRHFSSNSAQIHQ